MRSKDELEIVPDGEKPTETEPPVVARLVVEIRSDGSTTIARGAMESADGERAIIEARGDSPLSLALELAKVLVKPTRMMTGKIANRLPFSRRPLSRWLKK